MAYNPNNTANFIGAFSGAMAGMCGAGMGSGVAPIVPSGYDDPVDAALAFAAELDTAKGATGDALTASLIQAHSQMALRDRNPGASADLNAGEETIPTTNWTNLVHAVVAAVTQAEAALAGQGITPPAGGSVGVENNGVVVPGAFSVLNFPQASDGGGGTANISGALVHAFSTNAISRTNNQVTPTSDNVTVGPSGMVLCIGWAAGAAATAGDDLGAAWFLDPVSETGAPGGTALGPSLNAMAGATVNADGSYIVGMTALATGLTPGSLHKFGLSAKDLTNGAHTLTTGTGTVSYTFLSP